MKNNNKNKSFWATVPGILAGIAAIISAIAVLYIALYSITPAPAPHPTRTSTIVPTTAAPITIQPTLTFVAVEIKNFAYKPATITVSKGTTIVWTQRDSTSHTVTIAYGAGFDSGTLSPGQTFNYTFNEIGTFNYGCSIHTNMSGKVIVTQ
jgi:plastocyanin